MANRIRAADAEPSVRLETYRIKNTKPTAEERARRLVTTDVIG
jgi:hypothetical protein